MAQEIQTNARLYVSNGNLTLQRETSTSPTMSGGNYVSGAPSIPTTGAGTALPMGGVATAGWAWFRNLDLTNSVQIGVQTSGPTFVAFAKLKPGEAAVIRLATNAPCALANTAAVVLDYTILAD